MGRVAVFVFASLWVGCGGDDSPGRMDAGPADAGSADSSTETDGGGTDGGPGAACRADEECDDESFCNGEESCDPMSALADDFGCVAGMPPDCDDMIVCTLDSCSDELFACRHTPPDNDGDGHGDVACVDAGGTPLGDDCNDSDSLAFPGNSEVCDGHDEDCNPDTLGFLDADGDGSSSSACCNGATCGPDCNDSDNTVRPGVADGPTMACDGNDNDCDGSADEGCICGEGTSVPCGTMPELTMIGTCRPGMQFCIGGMRGTCTGNVPPAEELCDGLDNDCDGTPDEDVTRTYYRDADGDGFGVMGETTRACSPPMGYVSVPTDCNDMNGGVNPGAPEVCNLVDDDCDGSADEGLRDTFYRDFDGDGFGDAAMTMEACSRPMGYTEVSTDCNDADPTVHPGVADVCNGRDDDCDSTADPMCACTDGATRACGSSMTGRCRMGTQRCIGGIWAECVGAIEPVPESCNAADDDCDGTVDDGVLNTYYRDGDRDGFGVPSMTSMACTLPAGHSPLNTDCNDADGAVNPAATERCNAADDNCDGMTDPGCACVDGRTQACGSSSTGVCRMGTQQCVGGAWAGCIGSVEPGTETCNALDDDCDGMTDETLTVTCYVDGDSDGRGAGATVARCPDPTRMAFGGCPAGYSNLAGDCNDSNGTVRPGGTESCNGIDDDCDSMTDEMVLLTFYRDADRDGFGTPSMSMTGCTAPAGYVGSNTDCNDASAAVNPAATERCNGTDDNCVMGVDEGCMCTDGATRPCGSSSTGVCRMGLQQCVGGMWSTCSGNVDPGTETCNGLDDDCDGSSDEMLTVACYTDADSDGYGTGGTTPRCPDASRMMAPFGGCPAGYSATAGDCNDANGAARPGGAEVCNGSDDDCDGMSDEGVLATFYRDSDRDGFGTPTTSMTACTAPSGYVGSNTDCNDASAAVNPAAAERCNGIDDNCAMGADEGCMCTDGATRSCGTSSTGVCRMGLQQCIGGMWSTCSGNVEPGTETCNGLDDDCNGTVDDGLIVMCYRDGDGDGAGTGSLTSQCRDGTRMSFGYCPTGFSNVAGDCNDGAAAIRPGATTLESCNGVDDNCDGTRDNGPSMVCASGTSRAGTGMYMACMSIAGTYTCNPDCLGETFVGSPPPETCNGTDDNCNGASDDGFACVRASTGNPCITTCGTSGTYTCSLTCTVQACRAATETCNGCDDDGDAMTDEGVDVACWADPDDDGFAIAAAMTRRFCAVAGRESRGGCPIYWTNVNPTSVATRDCAESNAAINPGVTEVCDGVDQDCDGMADEGTGSTDCARTNALTACLAGRCVITGCTPNFGNCDGAEATGCEVDLRVTSSDCGGCGAICGPGGACASSECPSPPVDLAAGEWHTCTIKNGRVLCWGLNGYGELGDGTSTNRDYPVEVSGITDAIAVGAGRDHTCAIRSGGSVMCWGWNQYGQLGNGATASSSTPVAVTGITDAVQVIGGAYHTCVRRSGGGVSCFGRNNFGQLGNGTTTDSLVPVAVSGVTDASDVSTGWEFSCVRRTTSAVSCWGLNSNGQLGNGTTTNSSVPVNVTGIANATDVSTGRAHACARRVGSTVSCWGQNVTGELGNGTYVQSTTPVTVSGLADALESESHLGIFSCARRSGGLVSCWGDNSWGQLGDGTGATSNVPVQVVNLANAVQLVSGATHACVRRSSGSISCWGSNLLGELGDGTGMESNVPVRVRMLRETAQVGVSNHTCTRYATGDVACWGPNDDGQLGNGTTTDSSFPVAVTGLANAVEVDGGSTGSNNFACARRSTGQVSCWGDNSLGQLGNGLAPTDSTTPVLVTGVTDAIQIAVGGWHACALRMGRTVVCWGENNGGQLGDGTTIDRYSPVAVVGLTNVVQIAAGGSHVCARLATGAIHCWGDNPLGQLGNGTTSDSYTPTATLVTDAVDLAAGGASTCAVRASGQGVCWGSNSQGQVGDRTRVDRPSPTSVFGLADAVRIATSGGHTCAIRASGEAVCWGDNGMGQLGDGTTLDRLQPTAVTGLVTAFDIEPGIYTTCAHSYDGTLRTLYCWGSRSLGRLGDGLTTPNSSVPVLVLGL